MLTLLEIGVFEPQVNMQAIPTAANRSNASQIRIVVRTHITDCTVSKTESSICNLCELNLSPSPVNLDVGISILACAEKLFFNEQ